MQEMAQWFILFSSCLQWRREGSRWLVQEQMVETAAANNSRSTSKRW